MFFCTLCLANALLVPPPQSKWCLYKCGTCALNPADGSITCTKKCTDWIRDFPYPKAESFDQNDKFVGITCTSNGNFLCALTASGKVYCWDKTNDPGQIPRKSLGLTSAKSGHYVYIQLSIYEHTRPSFAAIRNDGVVELWGSAAGSHTATGTQDGRKILTPPTGRKVVNMKLNGLRRVWLLDDGTPKYSGSDTGNMISEFTDNGATSNIVDIGVAHNAICLLTQAGAWVCSIGGAVSKNTVVSDMGTKFIAPGGSVSAYMICGVTDTGKAMCWTRPQNVWEDKYDGPVGHWFQSKWTPISGTEFTECHCGDQQSCCLTDNGAIECNNQEIANALTLPGAGCSENGMVEIAATCSCGGSDCTAGKYCYNGACNDNTQYSACVADFGVAIVNPCVCAAATTLCAAEKFCYGGTCQATRRCNVRADVGKNIFYGAKVYGKWDAATSRMSMNITHPWDVTIGKIAFLGTTDTTLQYLTSNVGSWTTGTGSDPCNPVLVLDVPQASFFGAGSNFQISGSQLSSKLRVEATETISVTKNGHTYNYNRNIKNTVPVLVNLVTKTTINVRFTVGVKTPRNDFVLFIGAEDNFYGASPNVKITMQIHSGSCVDHTLTGGGVKVKAGLDNIATGQASLFAWTKDSSNKVVRSFTNNMCVETVDWTFVPKQYKANTYEIELEFTNVGTGEIFTTIAAIDIKQADVLDDIGFTSALTTYDDQACTAAATTFMLGQKFYAKVALTNLVVNTASITCNTFKIKQTKNGAVTTTDLKAETKYNFEEVVQTGNNHVCGAELESHHFEVSINGYDTLLETEILITYDQTNTRRLLISMPLEKGAGPEEGEVQLASVLDDKDYMFRNTPRAPDIDEMTAELYIEAEGSEEVADVLMNSSTKWKVLNIAGLFSLVGAAGFVFGYFSSKTTTSYEPLVEM